MATALAWQPALRRQTKEAETQGRTLVQDNILQPGSPAFKKLPILLNAKYCRCRCNSRRVHPDEAYGIRNATDDRPEFPGLVSKKEKLFLILAHRNSAYPYVIQRLVMCYPPGSAIAGLQSCPMSRTMK